MRRFGTFGLTFVLAMLISVPTAFAWCNGRGADWDGYGTHDWVLDEAIRIAGPEASWVDTETAFLATDDPDAPGESRALHVFYSSGMIGGAPQMASDFYYQVVKAYQAGDMKTASKALGLMSHYCADVLNPFHSTASASGSSLHNAYEYPVEELTDTPGENRDWVTPLAPAPLTDIRARVISAAAFSRAKYPALRASFSPTGTLNMDDPIVHALTVQVLNRAVNDLADILRAIPSGAGLTTPPRVMKADMAKHDPAQGSSPYAKVTCLDANGRPISGAAVRFAWPTAAGVVTDIKYTDSHGVARDYRVIGLDRLGAKVTVGVTSSASGASTVASTWYAPTIGLAAGTRGIKTTVSNSRPKRRTRVVATTAIHDIAGKPLAGRRITFTWKYCGKTVTATALTNAAGVARCSRNIGAAKRGYRVRVSGRISAATPRSSTATFVPR
ncbi:MAG TPA: hypothetical protein VIL17_06045 [Coriobacteriia bacterium]